MEKIPSDRKNTRKYIRFWKVYEENAFRTWKWNIIFLSQTAQKAEARVVVP